MEFEEKAISKNVKPD